MSNGWTEERKKKQRASIQRWRPWEKSTGPKSSAGKSKASKNALKHGFRCRALVRELKVVRQFIAGRPSLPWRRT